MTDRTVTGQLLGERFLEAVLEVTGLDATSGHEWRTRLAHRLRVSGLVVEDGGAEDEVIAALVHDARDEHTGRDRLPEIRRRYGAGVAEIVGLCVERFDDPRPAGRAHATDQLERIATASPGALRVSLADSLDHVRGLVVHLDTDWSTRGDRAGLPATDAGAYYARLARAFAGRQAGPRTDELARLARELEQRAGSAPPDHGGTPPTGPPRARPRTCPEERDTAITIHKRPSRTGGRIRLEAAATPMTSLGIRELAASVSAVVADVARSGRPAVVTKHGEPVAALVAIADFEDLLAARALRDSDPPTGSGDDHVE
jgi:prevent-host-death family protein